MIDYAKDGATCTIKNYETVRVVPDRKLTEFGYARLNRGRYVLPNRGYKSLSRAIYQKAHGSIPKNYDIHHIDGDRLNDDINNLIALPREEHVALHQNMHKAARAIEIVHVSNKEMKELFKGSE